MGLLYLTCFIGLASCSALVVLFFWLAVAISVSIASLPAFSPRDVAADHGHGVLLLAVDHENILTTSQVPSRYLKLFKPGSNPLGKSARDAEGQASDQRKSDGQSARLESSFPRFEPLLVSRSQTVCTKHRRNTHWVENGLVNCTSRPGPINSVEVVQDNRIVLCNTTTTFSRTSCARVAVNKAQIWQFASAGDQACPKRLIILIFRFRIR